MVPIGMAPLLRLLLHVLLLLSLSAILNIQPAVASMLRCQNGGSYDPVYGRCACTPHYHGAACEIAFAHDDPCSRIPRLPVISDAWAAHRPRKACSDSSAAACCNRSVDFSDLQPGWYRLQSPAGNCMTEGGCVDCGSRASYTLHELVREDNNNRALFSGKAYPSVWSARRRNSKSSSSNRSSCYLTGQTYFPVRLLRCSPHLTVYFLYPLPVGHHYCVGNSMDGKTTTVELKQDAKMPQLELEYYSLKNSRGRAGMFSCTVHDLLGRPGGIYFVRFRLSDRYGNTKEVTACGAERQVIAINGNKTYSCPSIEVLTPLSNIYGGTLLCEVQLRVEQSGWGNYSYQLVASNAHSFTFDYSYSYSSGDVGVLRPDQPLRLCIGTRAVPVLREEITFQVSVARQRTIPKDGVEIAVVHRSGDEDGDVPGAADDQGGCTFSTANVHKQSRVCFDLVLYNRDPEGKVVFGLSNAEQLNLVKLNISYGSLSSGISTSYDPQSNRPKLHLLEALELKVDLATLSDASPLNYLHVFSDPYVKPVNASYSDDSVYELAIARNQTVSFPAMRHKLLPYEVQLLFKRLPSSQDLPDTTVTTDVAIRYGYHIIRVHGSLSTGKLQHYIQWQPPKAYEQDSDSLKQRSDKELRGVAIESSGDVVRIKFLFYGTIIYVWRFRTTVSLACAHSFIMTQQEMHSLRCPKQVVEKHEEKFVLDVMIVPGFFDTPGNTDGLMYRRLGREAAIDWQGEQSLFSNAYVMKAVKQRKDLFMPVEALKICRCDSRERATGNCFVDVTNVVRVKRHVVDKGNGAESLDRDRSHRAPLLTNSEVEKSSKPARNKITPDEAKRVCAQLLVLRAADRNLSIAVCSAKADSVAQFEFVCAKYAVTLGNYRYAENLLNSLLAMCREGLAYNATEVRTDNGEAAIRVASELCPDNCSSRGVCLSGECVCPSGFSGAACEEQVHSLAALPTEISSPQKEALCPSDACSTALLLVRPVLKPGQAYCHVTAVATETVGSKGWLADTPAVHVTGNVVLCNLTNIHDWMVEMEKLYVVVEIQLRAEAWRSINRVKRLLYQSSCRDRPTQCFVHSWSCTTRSATQSWSMSHANTARNSCPSGVQQLGLDLHIQVAFVCLFSAVFLVFVPIFGWVCSKCYRHNRRANQQLKKVSPSSTAASSAAATAAAIGVTRCNAGNALIIERSFRPLL